MKKAISMFLVLIVVLCVSPLAFATSEEATVAADRLYELGLFYGVGTNSDGTPIYALDRAPTRAEAVTMLVRLLGKESEAKSSTWTIPFTDVADWAKPYVGYAYANKLTSGTSATTYSGDATITASQYLTFVLRALGYSDAKGDFKWDAAWELSDAIGLTKGEYNSETNRQFLRGDIAIISANALVCSVVGTKQTLLQKVQYSNMKTVTVSRESGSYVKANLREQIYVQTDLQGNIQWQSSNNAVATVQDGVVSIVGIGEANITASVNGEIENCVILVGTADGTPIDIGTAKIKKDGFLYTCGSCAGNGYYQDSPVVHAYTINGQYYLNSELLANVVNCYYGETTVNTSENPYILDKQLTTTSHVIRGSEKWHSDYINATDWIETRTITGTLPNGETIQYDFDSIVYIGGKKAEIVVYNIHYSDNEFGNRGFFYMKAVAPHLEHYNVECDLSYDKVNKQLVFDFDID